MTTTKCTRSAAGAIACAALLGACGGGGSSESSAPDNHPASARRVHGQVAKGPLRAARVRLYEMDGKGERASDTPIAQTVTADDGSWSVALDANAGALLVESSGGSYVNESDPQPDVSRKRTVTLASSEGFSAVLPADADTLALTAYSNALLVKARRETVGREFQAVLDNNRALQREAYGFDPLTTLPADPVAPAPDASEPSRSYALALGGAAQALNAIAISFGAAVPSFDMIAAVVTDLSDCTLDGAVDGAPIEVTVDGVAQSLPASDLAREILRFRNNNAVAYAQTPLLVPDAARCARSGAAPDTIAPELSHMPAPFTAAAIDARGTPASDPSIADVLASVTAVDDRPAAVALESDAPAMFPLGETRVTFTATDGAGNAAQASVVVTVADLTPPAIVAPPDRTVAQTDTLTMVALGDPAVSDNVSEAAVLTVSNDAPQAFPVGVTQVSWTVRDGAGLTASTMQSVTVLSTTTDSDGDGLSDGDELDAGSDPARADSDADGVGDGLEVRVGSDPTRAAAHVFYVSPEGDDAARGDSWAHAKADNAGLGVVPAGTSDAQPTFVLYAANAPAAASVLWSLALAPPCDHIVLVGSLGSDALEPVLDVVGAPTTTFALDGGTGLAVEGCTNVRLLALAITGAAESAIRVNGGSVALDQVHLRENASSTQGGGLAATDAQVVVRSSVIAGNRADAGGGIAVDGGSLVIEHSTISGNAAQTAGGGISLADTHADTRVYDTLVTVNGAAQGGGVALTQADRTMLGNLTIACNEARDPDGGAGLAFDGSGSGPRLTDSIFSCNRAAAHVADSVLGLSAAMSDFNLLEETALGAHDIDTSLTGAGLVAGFHLDQASSPGVNSGSRSAAAAALDSRYTDAGADATPDAGTVDRGYHYPDRYAAAGDFSIDQPMDTLIQPDTSLHVTLLRDGAPVGSGHKVIVSLGLDLVNLTSSANVDPLGNGRSAVLADLGNGIYVFTFGTPRAIGETTLSVEVNDVTLAHTLTVIVKSCDGPPDSCQRPHELTLHDGPDDGGDSPPGNDNGDEDRDGN